MNTRYSCNNPLQEASLYDAAQAIEYLDWVIKESLRIYPPAALYVVLVYSYVSLDFIHIYSTQTYSLLSEVMHY